MAKIKSDFRLAGMAIPLYRLPKKKNENHGDMGLFGLSASPSSLCEIQGPKFRKMPFTGQRMGCYYQKNLGGKTDVKAMPKMEVLDIGFFC